MKTLATAEISGYNSGLGSVAEWLKALVLKTSDGLNRS